MASLLTPWNVKTARRNWISAASLEMILEKVLVKMATRMVRKSVLPRKANVMMSIGPRIRWKSDARSMPVPSSPNQILSTVSGIRLPEVIGKHTTAAIL